MRVSYYKVALVAAALAPMAAGQSYTPSLQYASTSEQILRSMAVHIVRPAYPAEEIRSGHSGVVVVRVKLTLAGAVDKVSVLEAPSAATGKAVADAVAEWRFQPWTDPNTIISAKLTFYFTISNGRGAVMYPSEAPPFPSALTGRSRRPDSGH